jgi:hypothetical protein
MAKRNAESSTPSNPRGRPKSKNPKPTTPIVMTIRACPEWEAWIDGVREAMSKQAGFSLRIDRTDVVDSALGVLAERLGLTQPPPRY